ncbi:MAG: M3 family metallopeptidase, partial [Gammaproteobacteria bacterium]
MDVLASPQFTSAIGKQMYNPLLETSGLPKFSEIRAAHVEPALRTTLEQNRADLEAILSAKGEPNFDDSILPLEELRDRLHRTWSPVSHLHGVLTSNDLREAYNLCLPLLARYETEMAQDRRLFALYQKVSAGLEGTGNSPEQYLLDHALRDFRLAGVDLSAEKKARFKVVIEELTQLQAKFEQNLRDAMAAWSWHESRRERLAGIPETVLASASSAAAVEGKQGWLLHLNQPTYVAVITHAEDRDLRFEFYRAWATRASDEGPNAGQFDNSEIMDRILALRAEEAALVGFENFAEYSLATKMAGSVEEVRRFLLQLLHESRSVACRELAELEQFAGTELEAWDFDYYTEKLRRDRFSFSDEELRPYFPLPKVLEGLFLATSKLFGVSAERADNVDTWRSDVQFF